MGPDGAFPDDLKYTTEHEWVRPGPDGRVRVGITHYAQDQLGDVVFVSLPAVGDHVEAGQACGELESTKSVSDLYAPVSGEVVTVNPALETSPELINQQPYGEGWMIEIAATNPDAVDGLLSADAYRGQVGA